MENPPVELREVMRSAGIEQGHRRERLAAAREDPLRLHLDPDRVPFEPGHRERRLSRQARVAMAVLEHHVPWPRRRGARSGRPRGRPARTAGEAVSDPHEHVRHPAALRIHRLHVDDLASAAELLEPARNDHLALGLLPRLFEQRPPHRSGRPERRSSDTAAPASENPATTRKTPRESRHSPTPPAPNATISLSRYRRPRLMSTAT